MSDGGEYIRAGGTSMAAPMVAGAAAIGFQLDPSMTPNRAKALLRDSDRPLTDSIDELSLVDAARRFSGDGGRLANQGLEPNTYIDPATGEIDYTRSRWSRSRWSDASDLLRSSWSRSSWSLAPETRRQLRRRGRRPDALELEPLLLEPLELVDQLDQVTLARGPERTARPGIAWARRDSARLVSPHRS